MKRVTTIASAIGLALLISFAVARADSLGAAPAPGGLPDPATGSNGNGVIAFRGQLVQGGCTGTTFTPIGMLNSPVNGNVFGSDCSAWSRPGIRYNALAPGLAAIAGLTASAGDAYMGHHPRVVAPMFLRTTTTVRTAMTLAPTPGLASHVFPAPTGAVAFATKYFAIWCDVSLAANWNCASGDGTNESSIDTGVACVTSTRFVMDIDLTNWPTSFRCGINGTSVTKTNNVASVAAILSVERYMITTASAVPDLTIGDMTLLF